MREFDVRMNQAYERLDLKPGDIYESCSHHPVLCLGVDYKEDEIWGVSLIDGSYPRSCSLVLCGIRKLSLRQAWKIKLRGPTNADVREKFSKEERWWNASPEWDKWRVSLVQPRTPKPKGPK